MLCEHAGARDYVQLTIIGSPNHPNLRVVIPSTSVFFWSSFESASRCFDHDDPKCIPAISRAAKVPQGHPGSLRWITILTVSFRQGSAVDVILHMFPPVAPTDALAETHC